MKIRQRLLAVALCGLLAVGVLTIGYGNTEVSFSKEKGASEMEDRKDTLFLWYTDDALTDLLNSAAVTYLEEKGIRVIPTLKSGLEYPEEINQASMSSDTVPDFYIIPNDSLEKVYLAGLATEVDETGSFVCATNYCEPAINAVTYHGKTIAYPMYFETSALIYNKSYLYDFAKTSLEAIKDAREGEEAQALADAEQNAEFANGDEDEDFEELEDEEVNEDDLIDFSNGITEEMIQERMLGYLPDTFDTMLAFADEYDAPEQVESVLSWDVTDIFYTYFIAGAYMDFGGPNGDDKESINLLNGKCVRAMSTYQELNQFFSIDTEQSNYETVLQDFLDGKSVFLIATTESVARIQEAIRDGSFPYEYGTAMIPDINEELETKSLSVTDCFVVNGYSQHQKEANDFIQYFLRENSSMIYSRCGKAPSSKLAGEIEDIQAFVEEYGYSVPTPKLVEIANFWIYLEAAFSDIWNGKNAEATLKKLDEQIRLQLGGVTE